MTESQWNLPTPPGFSGFDAERPVTIYQRALPHWRQDGATYFVTFRQRDSLPQSVIRAVKRERLEWECRNPAPRSHKQWEEISRKCFARIERSLDQGIGSCVLRLPDAQNVMSESLRFFDGDRYLLGACVVMPNYVHLLVKPLDPKTFSLQEILHSWKRHTGRELNRLMNSGGTFWQEESFDRIVRDEEHLFRSVQYIGDNPIKAGLSEPDYGLWIRPEWKDHGWGFRRLQAERDARVGNPCYGSEIGTIV